MKGAVALTRHVEATASGKERRLLVAVLHADIVGYTLLIAADDAGTAHRIRDLREHLVQPIINAFGGRIWQTAGDSLLVVFESVEGAVRCAVQIQQQMLEHDAEAPPDQRIRLRVGINIGDAITQASDLHGEAVVIAVRLETACPPGGVCISRAVYENVGQRLGLDFEPMGPLALKNIARPVEAFMLRLDPEALAAHAVPASATPFPEFGGRPAIAVLPFACADPQDEPFSETLTDELISALSAWRSFPVIARASVFRGSEADARGAGRQLGARYIVSGAVRRIGAVLRIAVDLVDADSGEALVAERFDIKAADAATVPDTIVRKLAAELAPELQRVERERAHRRTPEQQTAYGFYVRGDWHHQRYTREDLEKAEALYYAALEKDPGFSRAAANLSLSRNFVGLNHWVPDPSSAFREALLFARRAVAADPRHPQAHFALGIAWMNLQNLPAATASLSDTVRLNPSHASSHAALGQVLNYLDRPAQALPALNLALRLNPRGNSRFVWLPYLAASHYLLGDYRACLEVCHQALGLKPDYPNALRYMAAALGQLGWVGEAAPLLPLLRRIDGNATAMEAMLSRYYVPSAIGRLMEGTRRAGFS
jgi:adenylate cyclase